jgi:hypothetical protein
MKLFATLAIMTTLVTRAAFAGIISFAACKTVRRSERK